MSRLFPKHRYIMNHPLAGRGKIPRKTHTRQMAATARTENKILQNFSFKMNFVKNLNTMVEPLLFFKNNELIYYYYRKTFKKQVLFFVPSEAWHCYNSWFCFFRVNNNLQLSKHWKTFIHIWLWRHTINQLLPIRWWNGVHLVREIFFPARFKCANTFAGALQHR